MWSVYTSDETTLVGFFGDFNPNFKVFQLLNKLIFQIVALKFRLLQAAESACVDDQMMAN